MNPRFRLTESALREIQEITDYLAQNYGFSQSEKFARKLNAQFSRIVQFPKIGKPRDEILPGSRMLSVDRYLILYAVLEDQVEILRVISGYRDLSQLFTDEIDKRDQTEAAIVHAERQLREATLDFGMNFVLPYRNWIQRLIQRLRQKLADDDVRSLDLIRSDLQDAVWDLERAMDDQKQADADDDGFLV
jgi:toxin ParE1/3/4